jgi:hypothetical protein
MEMGEFDARSPAQTSRAAPRQGGCALLCALRSSAFAVRDATGITAALAAKLVQEILAQMFSDGSAARARRV